MSKSISVELLDHKRQPAQTLAYLCKIGPLRDGSHIRMTSLDRDFEYDDGNESTSGAETYYAHTGVQLSNLSSANDLSVDNGEAQSLVPIYPGQGISVAAVDSGSLDGVEFVIYEVNYKDASMGHEIMAGGTIGEVRLLPGDLLTFELRSWSQLLKQNSVCERGSRTCRVKRFGSQPGDERYPCNYNIAPEWITGQVVTGIGSESVREFTASGLLQADDYFAPGVVKWLTGANQDMEREIEAFTSGGNISLLFTTRYPIQNGDTFDIRRDCTRKWAGHNSCETYNNRPWFRGEPHRPVSDSIALTIPGAAA